MTDIPEPSAYVRGLPIGAELPLPADSFVAWRTFPFAGELTVKRLEPPELPEPPRNGEDGPEDCHTCNKPVGDALWADEHWRVDTIEPHGLPAAVMLQPRGHYDLADLPAERAAELGAMLQRCERAIRAVGGVARVHVNRWGDGGAHLHFWLLARPEGMTQLRGTFLSLWDELLPPRTPEQLREANSRIAAELARGD
ncbi:hypothetical protein SRB5_65460 [Streptomyces sp. RB5]|uniref:Diadenosine tetraphosphate (Ap4A) hydrolase n=1 Tax=Streptomyces smaragdinus TaxID=2585196 RepID=A0A7K0CSF0_9ACTN|nr:hypothetical protein [Streptomyces smaragdinus]MQY16348.1 hypothetical protein [Streptomyces smaragdinus]